MIQYNKLNAGIINTIEAKAAEYGMTAGKPGIRAFVNLIQSTYGGLSAETIKAVLAHNIGEEWKKLSTRFNKYSISNFGRVKGQRGTIISTYGNAANVETFDPYDKDRKRAHIHVREEVARLFMGKKPSYEITHMSDWNNTIYTITIDRTAKKKAKKKANKITK